LFMKIEKYRRLQILKVHRRLFHPLEMSVRLSRLFHHRKPGAGPTTHKY